MDGDVVDSLAVFKIRYRAKNAYGALRLNTAYGFTIPSPNYEVLS